MPLTRTLIDLASLAGIRGDAADAEHFARAAELVHGARVETDADLGPLLAAPPPGASPEVLRLLGHMYDAGGWVLVESALADLPADLRWLFESGAVTIEQLAALHRSLGAVSAIDLSESVRLHTIRDVPGLGLDVETAIEGALPTLRRAIPRVPLGRALALADPIVQQLVSAPAVAWAEPVGSLRRGDDLVGDIEIVAAAGDPGRVFDDILEAADAARILHRGPRRLYFRTDRVQIGVQCPPPERAGALLLHLTGNRMHLNRLQTRAEQRGWRLEAGGLLTTDGLRVAADEEAIYRALELPWLPPEIREGDEAIVAADAGRLPQLVSSREIRGDLHMHSDWSDGRDRIETMVQACVALGYEYMAITDHSPHSAASRNLTVDGVKQQADEIAALRERYPQIAILHGCEVDILPDARLDFSDRILESFDIVLASLHDPAGQAPARLLARYEAAMRHPLVTVITHPANRLVPSRPGYDIDFDRLFEMALSTRTVLEIDGAPSHLDLDATRARKAGAAGVTLSVDSDSHRADLLGRQMRMGLLIARRAWLEPRHVLNARPIGELREVIAAKRRK